MEHWKIPLTLLIALAVFGVCAYLYQKQSPKEPLDEILFDWDRVERVYKEEGKFKAYEEVVREAAGMPLSAQHVGAHVFGKGLYDAEGVEAITVCDDQLLYGCFHSVIMAAVGDRGLGSIKEFQKVCDAQKHDFKLACEHGIGHGIMGLLGYSVAGIRESLNLCDVQLPDSNPIDGCKGGVLMENVQRLYHDGTMRTRAFDASRKWGPCDTLDARYLDTCAYTQPLWWTSSITPFPENGEEFAREMGAWCKEAPGGASAEQYCISGIGNVMYALVATSTERSASICAAATDNLRNRYQCHLAAARRFLYSVPIETALRACDGLYPEIREKCRKEALAATGKSSIAE